VGPKDNIAAKEEHVPEVERQNRVIKGKGEGSYTNSALQEYLDED
jgi:bacterioferritin (cytochrome b1)